MSRIVEGMLFSSRFVSLSREGFDYLASSFDRFLCGHWVEDEGMEREYGSVGWGNVADVVSDIVSDISLE